MSEVILESAAYRIEARNEADGRWFAVAGGWKDPMDAVRFIGEGHPFAEIRLVKSTTTVEVVDWPKGAL